MIKNIEELKALITWAKDNKVKHLELEGIKFELSEIAFIDSIQANQSSPDFTQLTDEAKHETEKTKEDQEKEDEDMLLWSSQG
jgi:hypothetical protein